MTNINTLPDPDDPDWDDRIAEFVKGTGVDPDIGRRLVRDATRVADGDLSLEEFGGRYPTRVVRTLGIDEILDEECGSESQSRDLPVDYTQSHDPSQSRSSTGKPPIEKSESSNGDSCCGCSSGTVERADGVNVDSADIDPETITEQLDFVDPEAVLPDTDIASAMEDLGQDWDIDDIDESWEANARQDLTSVGADTELGIEMSRDALRVAQGELSKAEFHAKYHEAVLDEFGIDHRPTRYATPTDDESNREDGSAVGRPSTGRTLPSVPGQEGAPDTSRRRFLKGVGGTAAAGATLGLAGCAGLAQQGTNPASAEGDVQLGMAIDLERCIGCLLCAEGCMEENNTDLGAFWMHVFQYEEDEKGDVQENYMPRPCQHCSEPSCSYVCPTQARYKRDGDGIVLTNYDTCIGCKYCQVACPYGVNYLGKDDPAKEQGKSPGFWHPEKDDEGVQVAGPSPEGVMSKCTFCVHRQDEPASAGTTACEDACPVDAIHFGDMEDPESEPRQHMREKRESGRFDLLEELGNEPNIVYLGDEPSGRAESTDGPYTYRDLDMEPLDEPATEDENS